MAMVMPSTIFSDESLSNAPSFWLPFRVDEDPAGRDSLSDLTDAEFRARMSGQDIRSLEPLGIVFLTGDPVKYDQEKRFGLPEGLLSLPFPSSWRDHILDGVLRVSNATLENGDAVFVKLSGGTREMRCERWIDQGWAEIATYHLGRLLGMGDITPIWVGHRIHLDSTGAQYMVPAAVTSDRYRLASSPPYDSSLSSHFDPSGAHSAATAGERPTSQASVGQGQPQAGSPAPPTHLAYPLGLLLKKLYPGMIVGHQRSGEEASIGPGGVYTINASAVGMPGFTRDQGSQTIAHAQDGSSHAMPLGGLAGSMPSPTGVPVSGSAHAPPGSFVRTSPGPRSGANGGVASAPGGSGAGGEEGRGNALPHGSTQQGPGGATRVPSQPGPQGVRPGAYLDIAMAPPVKGLQSSPPTRAIGCVLSHRVPWPSNSADVIDALDVSDILILDFLSQNSDRDKAVNWMRASVTSTSRSNEGLPEFNPGSGIGNHGEAGSSSHCAKHGHRRIPGGSAGLFPSWLGSKGDGKRFIAFDNGMAWFLPIFRLDDVLARKAAFLCVNAHGDPAGLKDAVCDDDGPDGCAALGASELRRHRAYRGDAASITQVPGPDPAASPTRDLPPVIYNVPAPGEWPSFQRRGKKGALRAPIWLPRPPLCRFRARTVARLRLMGPLRVAVNGTSAAMESVDSLGHGGISSIGNAGAPQLDELLVTALASEAIAPVLPERYAAVEVYRSSLMVRVAEVLALVDKCIRLYGQEQVIFHDECA
eukprot:jgi/Mesvir1/17213/Mv07627-RA.1